MTDTEVYLTMTELGHRYGITDRAEDAKMVEMREIQGRP